MRILYIADGRSPTALSWISYFIQGGHSVHLVSTYPCAPVSGVASQYVVPVAMSNLYAQKDQAGKERWGWLRRILPVRVRTVLRQVAVPLSFSQAISRLQGIVERVQPEIIHAMRIPYEGILAAEALHQITHEGRRVKIPFIISVWGNDFTLHAEASEAVARGTRQAIQTCDALHTDCQRDQQLAVEWGFAAEKPKIILPGGGGIQLDVFHPAEELEQDSAPLTIINPRGYRAYVQNDTFFQAIPLVTDKVPQVQFTCPGMQGEGQAEGWVAELGIEKNVQLLAQQSRQQMAELFRQAQISLSITTHDGTPNTLLEAMACGCFPIAGELESIREWITPGKNGLLVDPNDPQALAGAILRAIESPELRRQARSHNLELVQQRAEYGKCMRQAEEFYQRVASG